jgi:hypothetical protein
MENDERNKALEERRVAMMQGDFNPGYTRESTPDPQHRLANAAEYSAYQLGKISHSLAELVSILKHRAP